MVLVSIHSVAANLVTKRGLHSVYLPGRGCPQVPPTETPFCGSRGTSTSTQPRTARPFRGRVISTRSSQSCMAQPCVAGGLGCSGCLPGRPPGVASRSLFVGVHSQPQTKHTVCDPTLWCRVSRVSASSSASSGAASRASTSATTRSSLNGSCASASVWLFVQGVLRVLRHQTGTLSSDHRKGAACCLQTYDATSLGANLHTGGKRDAARMRL